jgi:hypothetical protein
MLDPEGFILGRVGWIKWAEIDGLRDPRWLELAGFEDP